MSVPLTLALLMVFLGLVFGWFMGSIEAVKKSYELIPKLTLLELEQINVLRLVRDKAGEIIDVRRFGWDPKKEN